MKTLQVAQADELIRRLQEANTNSTGGLDTGAWVAIIISIVAVLALLAFAGWYFFLRSGSSMTTTSFLGSAIGKSADSQEQVGKWTFKALLYGQTPDYLTHTVTTAAYMGPTTTWRKEGNPLGLTWLSWGIIATVVVLVATGGGIGIAAAAGAFNGNSTAT